jgi:hypothetical protein
MQDARVSGRSTLSSGSWSPAGDAIIPDGTPSALDVRARIHRSRRHRLGQRPERRALLDSLAAIDAARGRTAP